MRTIRELIKEEKKVYIFLRNKAIAYRFVSDAEREGITFGDGVKRTERPVDDIMTVRFAFLGGLAEWHIITAKTQ